MLSPAVDSVDAVLDELRRAPWAAGHVVHEARLAAEPARYGDWPAGLHPALAGALGAEGVRRLYSHQSEAVALALDGRDVVVVTPTASGKSLCYVLPVLDAWLRDAEARALWLFPTKALAQDQLASLHHVARHLPT